MAFRASELLVVREEPEGLRTYCHIGTGNYNSKTATLYTDLGLFTCNPSITDDVIVRNAARYEQAVEAHKFAWAALYE